MSNMKWPFSRPDKNSDPGIAGIARVDSSVARVLRRVEPGDIVVINEPDLTQAAAEDLIAAGVIGVINASPALSHTYPTYGTLVLLQAGVAVVDETGVDIFDGVRDGRTLSMDAGTIWVKGEVVAQGNTLTLPAVSQQIEDRRTRVNDQLAAFAGNTAEFLTTESPLLLEGMGVPDIDCDMAERKVVLVSYSESSAAELESIRWFIKKNKPVLVGVGAGAELLVDAGYKPDLLVGDPHTMANETLQCGAQLVLPAAPDGHAEGLERVQDQGVSAITFPAVADAEELALLLADYGEASLVVAVGLTMTLQDFLDPDSMSTGAAAFLTRLKVAHCLVDAQALSSLRPDQSVSWWAVLLALLSAAFAALVVYLYGFPDTAGASTIIDNWNSFATTVQGWY